MVLYFQMDELHVLIQICQIFSTLWTLSFHFYYIHTISELQRICFIIKLLQQHLV